MYLAGVMAASQSPKLLVGVRVPGGMPSFCWGVVYSGTSTLGFELSRFGSIPDTSAKIHGLLVIMGARGLCTAQVRVRFSYGPP